MKKLTGWQRYSGSQYFSSVYRYLALSRASLALSVTYMIRQNSKLLDNTHWKYVHILHEAFLCKNFV